MSHNLKEKKEMKKMRYEIKYWNLDDDEEYKILCRTKNQVISKLTKMLLDKRMEYVEVSDLKRAGVF